MRIACCIGLLECQKVYEENFISHYLRTRLTGCLNPIPTKSKNRVGRPWSHSTNLDLLDRLFVCLSLLNPNKYILSKSVNSMASNAAAFLKQARSSRIPEEQLRKRPRVEGVCPSNSRFQAVVVGSVSCSPDLR